jgi:hypothetical protein
MPDLAIIHQELHTQPTKKGSHMTGKIPEMQQEQEMRKPLASTLTTTFGLNSITAGSVWCKCACFRIAAKHSAKAQLKPT